MTTVNISLPTSMYNDAKHMLSRRGYSSISEFVRDALREKIYPELTENGFTKEFEEEVLKSAAEPRRKDKVWRTEKDIDRYFNALKERIAKRKKLLQNDQN